MANQVIVSGMFGSGKTYFADSPVVIDISGLAWPPSSPFNIVLVEVLYNNIVVGSFRAETGGQASISFDISSALRAIWNSEDFRDEVSDAQTAADGGSSEAWERGYRTYYLRIYTEYLSSDGVFTTTQCQDGNGNYNIPGGRCMLGGLTEMERAAITDKADADASHWEHTNIRNGDASTKPTSSPERVGIDSITSWVDVTASGTTSRFYPASADAEADGQTAHAPIVLRDSQAYTDFLFVNRRGAVETCSGQTLEALSIDVEMQQYARVERPSFVPSRSITSRATGGRRSWAMSSGAQTRDWAAWWVLEFLMARRHWMRYNGVYVPVIVEPAKKSTGIYDRTKQELAIVDFTVTLALEG